jgi:hypothetical protein
MKRIITLILATIISFNLSACGKTKQLIQSNISTQQSGSDATDYKKLHENECSVSSVRNYINWGLGLVASVAVLVSLHFADKAIYSSFKKIAAKSELDAYNIYHTEQLPNGMSANRLLSLYRTTINTVYSLWTIAKEEDKPSIRNDFDRISSILPSDKKLNENQQVQATTFAKAFQFSETKTSWISSKLPFRYLGILVKYKFIGGGKK